MKKNDNNLFYTCSLIELIGRTARQKRKDVVNLMGEKIIRHIYHHADTLHCEPIAQTADYYIDFCRIPTGEFDNISSCKYTVPSYWDIGKVYARLIEDIRKDDVISALIRVYNSTVSDSISYYNSDFFYQPRDFIKEQFLSEENAVADKTSKKRQYASVALRTLGNSVGLKNPFPCCKTIPCPEPSCPSHQVSPQTSTTGMFS